MSWIIVAALKIASAFMSAEDKAKQSFSGEACPEELLKMVDRSQLQEKYGGTIPNVTRFWPPIVPPMP